MRIFLGSYGLFIQRVLLRFKKYIAGLLVCLAVSGCTGEVDKEQVLETSSGNVPKLSYTELLKGLGDYIENAVKAGFIQQSTDYQSSQIELARRLGYIFFTALWKKLKVDHYQNFDFSKKVSTLNPGS